MKFYKLFSAVLLCITGTMLSNIIHVPADYTTIQAAINASVNGDTVQVAPGVYSENINFRGRKIVLTSEYYITQNPVTIYNTIIDGNNPAHPDTASCVIINNGEDSTTVLQGFAITRGAGTKWTDEHGAGIYREGGGILVQYSSPVIQNNIIYNNIVTNLTGVISTGGGGVRIGDSYVRFYNNIVSNNRANYGSGVVLNYTGGEYKNNVICANYGSFQFGAGSGLWINNVFSRPKIIINNTISGNTSTTGICGVYSSSAAELRNNIIWGNTSPSNVQVSGTLGITYSDVQGGYTGSGNINLNPLFMDSNYVLQTGSPCVDKGDSGAAYNDIPDPVNPSNAKYPSRGGLRNDMGAYGGPLAKLLTNQLIGINNSGNQLPKEFALHQNYPNPFNPSTNIIFDLTESGYVSLKLYDMAGRELYILVNGYIQAGRHNFVFNSGSMSSGVYFYKIEYNGYTASKRMILIK